MFVDFFIKRPVFASVCAMVLVLAGAVSIPSLPIAQYPRLAPPQVGVNAYYIGASAQTVESAVTIPLEQAINGAEGMKYMTSQSGSDGSSGITVVFDLDRDVDIAAVDVQNRVSTALGRLPAQVNTTGVSVSKSSSTMIMAVGVYSPDGTLSDLFMSNYLDLYVRDALKRVRGVSSVEIFNERKYAMRLWLDPSRLAARGLTSGDVLSALREQNIAISAGQVGAQPAPTGQQYQVSVRAIGRLSEPSEFERVILKTGSDGTAVLLKDVGTVEIGAEDYSGKLRFDRKESVGLGVNVLANANALEVDKLVRTELERLAKSFPPGMKYEIAFDPTEAVSDSIREVLNTLLIAIFLVIAVIFLFLQDWRSTLIPAVTIPVSLIGTFSFIKAFNFSINTLTLFGLTLATGLVVDDAIVVIENIERHMRERGTSAPKSASSAMREVASAVIATSLVLVAVFVPVSFFPGTTGRLYKQFSLTIAFSIAISAFNALTLAPALAAVLLKGHSDRPKWSFFAAVNRAIAWLSDFYSRTLRRVVSWPRAMAALFVVLFLATIAVYKLVPSGFVPAEDQNNFLVIMQGPEGASLDYTSRLMAQVEDVLYADPDVLHVFAVAGWSFGGSAPNRAILFPNCKPLKDRPGEAHSMNAVLNRVRGKLSAIPGAQIFAFAPPPIDGTDAVDGFAFEILDQANSTPQRLAEVATAVATEAGQRKELTGVYNGFTANDPQFVVRINREKAKAVGVPLTEIADALEVFMGSSYINDFDFNARSYRVYAQAGQNFRAKPQDIGQFYVRTTKGAMISLDNLVTVTEETAPPIIKHYDLFRATEMNGSPAPGYSSGQAIAAMEEVAHKVLPAGMSFQWSGLSLEELESSQKSLLIFGLGVLFVFLVLAAQYESFALPFIILLAVPVAILGALAAQFLRGLPNDVFCQIGLVMLVGLASKNAILIVEFAEQLRASGKSIEEAAIEAAHVRLRPILMTSLAFILGILPLVFAHGAGQEARHSLGTPVLGGMLVSTVLNLYFIPVLYIGFERLRERFTSPKIVEDEAEQHA